MSTFVIWEIETAEVQGECTLAPDEIAGFVALNFEDPAAYDYLPIEDFVSGADLLSDLQYLFVDISADPFIYRNAPPPTGGGETPLSRLRVEIAGTYERIYDNARRRRTVVLDGVTYAANDAALTFINGQRE